MGCAVEEVCPALKVPLDNWELEDPKGQSPEKVAEIRDTIELRVRNLIGDLGVSPKDVVHPGPLGELRV
jgi:arsenate reductase